MPDAELEWAKHGLEVFKAESMARVNLIDAYGQLAVRLAEAQHKMAEARKTHAEAAAIELDVAVLLNAVKKAAKKIKAFESERDAMMTRWQALMLVQDGQANVSSFARGQIWEAFTYWMTKIPTPAVTISDSERAADNFDHPSKPVFDADATKHSHDRLLVKMFLKPNNFMPKVGMPAYVVIYNLVASMHDKMLEHIQSAQKEIDAVTARLQEIEDMRFGPPTE